MASGFEAAHNAPNTMDSTLARTPVRIAGPSDSVEYFSVIYHFWQAMAYVASLAIDTTPGPSALVAMPLGARQPSADENATPSGSKRTLHGVETPSGEYMVQLARECAATVIHCLENASVSADLLAHTKKLNEV